MTRAMGRMKTWNSLVGRVLGSDLVCRAIRLQRQRVAAGEKGIRILSIS